MPKTKGMYNIKVNSLKIKSRILELGLNQEYIAKKIGVNYTTLNLKVNNKRPITLSEVAGLITILELNTFTDLIEYFGLGLLNLTNCRENATEKVQEVI